MPLASCVVQLFLLLQFLLFNCYYLNVTVTLSVLAIALYYKNFPQMFSCLRRPDRRESDMGHVCMH